MKKKLPFLLTFIGIVVFCFLTIKTGIHPLLSALGKVGIGGFGLLVLAQFAVNLLLGVAWKSSIPTISFLRLTASRFIRDAAATCLPFSQLGGMVIGIRAITAGRNSSNENIVPDWPEGIAANLVDITTEVLSQMAFVIFALLCLIGHQNTERFVWPLAIGLALSGTGIAGFIWTQQRSENALTKTAHFLARHIAADWCDSLLDSTSSFQNALNELWSNPSRIAYGTFFHLLCWIGGGVITWLSLEFLGVSLNLFDAIAVEGVVCSIISVGFLVPGSLGVQEGAYVALGLLFGVNTDIAFSLSLLRRGRDIVIGVPVLLLWQVFEIRFLCNKQKAHSDG